MKINTIIIFQSKLKKLLLLSLMMMLCFNTTISFAATKNSRESNLKAINKTGIEIEDVEYLPDEKIQLIADVASENPMDVAIQSEEVTFDELKDIEKIVNMSDEKLKNTLGLSKSQITSFRNNIQKLKEYSKEELKEKYGMSNSEILIYNHVLKKINNYKEGKCIDDKNKVTLSSSIGKSELEFKQTIVRDNRKKKVTYNVTEYFNWKKGYYDWNLGFEDIIGVSWTGGFNVKAGSNKIKYYAQTGNLVSGWGWGTYKGQKQGAFGIKPSKGLTYSFNQNYKSNIISILAKSGYIDFILTSKYQKKQKKEAQIVSRYGHKRIGVKSISLGVKEASVEFGNAYTSTDDAKTTAKLAY